MSQHHAGGRDRQWRQWQHQRSTSAAPLVLGSTPPGVGRTATALQPHVAPLCVLQPGVPWPRIAVPRVRLFTHPFACAIPTPDSFPARVWAVLRDYVSVRVCVCRVRVCVPCLRVCVPVCVDACLGGCGRPSTTLHYTPLHHTTPRYATPTLHHTPTLHYIPPHSHHTPLHHTTLHLTQCTTLHYTALHHTPPHNTTPLHTHTHTHTHTTPHHMYIPLHHTHTHTHTHTHATPHHMCTHTTRRCPCKRRSRPSATGRPSWQAYLSRYACGTCCCCRSCS